VEIPKPNGGVRSLGIPTVIDRTIQQAISQVITPIFDGTFHDSSYGFREGRCAQNAIEKALNLMNRHYKWIVDIDLEKFFDTVNHDKLMTLVAKRVKDGDVVSLIRKYLVSGAMIDDEYKESVIGTPQGGNLSPLLSNIMLNELDWELERRSLNFVRYADDCVILVGSEKSANRVMAGVTKYIEENLWLKVNADKSKIETPRGLKYLGFGFYFDSFQKQYKARPHADSILKLKDKIKEITSRRWGVSMDYRIMRLNWAIRGWINYFRIARMKTVCKEIDQHMRFRLRMCIWKQWKKPRTRYKALMKLGIARGKAWEWANSRKGYARVASSYIMHRAVTNEILKRKGLVFLLDHYHSVHI
jgi:group II intron reverse transcriptase/maturase